MKSIYIIDPSNSVSYLAKRARFCISENWKPRNSSALVNPSMGIRCEWKDGGWVDERSGWVDEGRGWEVGG